jgi:hypothetical protein
VRLRLYVCPTCGEARLINPPLFGFAAQQLAAGNVYCHQDRGLMLYVKEVALG